MWGCVLIGKKLGCQIKLMYSCKINLSLSFSLLFSLLFFKEINIKIKH